MLEQSANGAKYNSQGQARAKRARRPWLRTQKRRRGLKGRNSIPPFQGWARFNFCLSRGDALRACPWLLYFAPLALFALAPGYYIPRLRRSL